MPLPSSYLDATWRYVTPVCPERKRLGVCFEIPGAAPVRLAFTRDEARELVKSLTVYINSSGGVVERAMSNQLSIYTVIRFGAYGEFGSRKLFSQPLDTDYARMSDRHMLAVEIPRVLAELSESMVADSALVSDGIAHADIGSAGQGV